MNDSIGQKEEANPKTLEGECRREEGKRSEGRGVTWPRHSKTADVAPFEACRGQRHRCRLLPFQISFRFAAVYKNDILAPVLFDEFFLLSWMC